MRRTNIMFLLLLLMVSSCIKPYDPDIESREVQKYVVTGQITDGYGSQKVNVSVTSPIGDPQYLPVSGCDVVISDDKGNVFPTQYMGQGDYLAWINSGFLTAGTSFMVRVTTPDGDEIISDYDKLAKCPGVDSVYYVRKELQGNNPGQISRGIQFYIDLDATGTDSHYFRWDAIETWEYHADYPLEWYYDGQIHHVSPPDYSRKVCWSTTKTADIYTLSTNNLVNNKYLRFPLHFVGNNTSRLMYGYSLLIRQYSLSEAAYVYWDQLRANSNQQGGLYEKQPLAIKGNMHNITHPEKNVLGFLSASAVKTKRIFIKDVPDLPLYFSTSCYTDTLREGFSVYEPFEYPIYLKVSRTYILVLNESCVNCLALGGTNVKPNFWPN